MLITKMSLHNDMCVWCAVSELGLLGHFFWRSKFMPICNNTYWHHFWTSV